MYAYVTLPFNRRRLATTSRRLCYSNRDNESSAAMDGTPRQQAHPPNRHASKPSASGYFLPHHHRSPIQYQPASAKQAQKKATSTNGETFRRQASRRGHERNKSSCWRGDQERNAKRRARNGDAIFRRRVQRVPGAMDVKGCTRRGLDVKECT